MGLGSDGKPLCHVPEMPIQSPYGDVGNAEETRASCFASETGSSCRGVPIGSCRFARAKRVVKGVDKTSVVFRFDDSLKNTFEVVYPEFQRRGWKGAIGIIAGYVGGVWPDGAYRDKPQMTVEELSILRDEGWDMCSHSLTHPKFDTLTEAQATFEIMESKRWIINHLCVVPHTFIYPYGKEKYNDIAREHYVFEATIDYGPWLPPVTRIPIYGDFPSYTELPSLLAALEPNEAAVLLFHSVVEGGEAWEHTPEQFIRILDVVEDSGLRVRTLQELVSSQRIRYPTIKERIRTWICWIKQWMKAIR